MKKLNHYITEAWSSVKKQSLKADMEAWCEEMGIRNYTINDKGEIDVDDCVSFTYKTFKEIPYKFGTVTSYFSLRECKNLISLKNCPDYVEDFFSCSLCFKLDSLEGCPKEVGGTFYCNGCKREFTKEEIESLCKVNKNVII